MPEREDRLDEGAGEGKRVGGQGGWRGHEELEPRTSVPNGRV